MGNFFFVIMHSLQMAFLCNNLDSECLLERTDQDLQAKRSHLSFFEFTGVNPASLTNY